MCLNIFRNLTIACWFQHTYTEWWILLLLQRPYYKTSISGLQLQMLLDNNIKKGIFCNLKTISHIYISVNYYLKGRLFGLVVRPTTSYFSLTCIFLLSTFMGLQHYLVITQYALYRLEIRCHLVIYLGSVA